MNMLFKCVLPTPKKKRSKSVCRNKKRVRPKKKLSQGFPKTQYRRLSEYTKLKQNLNENDIFEYTKEVLDKLLKIFLGCFPDFPAIIKLLLSFMLKNMVENDQEELDLPTKNFFVEIIYKNWIGKAVFSEPHNYGLLTNHCFGGLKIILAEMKLIMERTLINSNEFCQIPDYFIGMEDHIYEMSKIGERVSLHLNNLLVKELEFDGKFDFYKQKKFNNILCISEGLIFKI